MSDRSSSIVRVMIVEDDRDTREHFAAAISSDSRTALVEKVSTGRQAIARLPAASPDVLLVDLGLPDIHGTEVIRHAARDKVSFGRLRRLPGGNRLSNARG